MHIFYSKFQTELQVLQLYLKPYHHYLFCTHVKKCNITQILFSHFITSKKQWKLDDRFLKSNYPCKLILGAPFKWWLWYLAGEINLLFVPVLHLFLCLSASVYLVSFGTGNHFFPFTLVNKPSNHFIHLFSYVPSHMLPSTQTFSWMNLPSEAWWTSTKIRTFSVVATTLWNVLFLNALLVPTLKSFRTQFKIWLWCSAFGEMGSPTLSFLAATGAVVAKQLLLHLAAASDSSWRHFEGREYLCSFRTIRAQGRWQSLYWAVRPNTEDRIQWLRLCRPHCAVPLPLPSFPLPRTGTTHQLPESHCH